jgi:O-methyltransferase
MRLHVVSILANWRICEFYRAVTLPSLFHAFQNRDDSELSLELFISTNSRDKLMIEQDPVFEALSNEMECHLVLNAELPQEGGQVSAKIIENIENNQLNNAAKNGAAILFLPAWGVLSNQSLNFLNSKFIKGAGAVFAPKIIVNAEQVLEILSNAESSDFSSTNLSRVGIENLSDLNQRYFIENEDSAIWKSQLAFQRENAIGYKLLDVPPVALFPRVNEQLVETSRLELGNQLTAKEAKVPSSSQEFLLLEADVDALDQLGNTSKPKQVLLRQFITQILDRKSNNLNHLPLTWLTELSDVPDDQNLKAFRREVFKIRLAAILLCIALVPLQAMRWLAKFLIKKLEFCLKTINAICLSRQSDLFLWPVQNDSLDKFGAASFYRDTTNLSDLSSSERKIITELTGNVCGGPEAITALVRAVDYIIKNDIPGSFVECGVFRGGNIVAIIQRLLELGIDDRDIYLYDTFSGMPRPDAVDAYIDGEPALAVWEQLQIDDEGSSDWVNCSIETVKKWVNAQGYPEARIHYVEGLVEDTIPQKIPEEIALLRLDTDFYKSTRHELEYLYPLLRQRGVLIIDDYGTFYGAKLATDEYFEKIGFAPYLARVDAHVRLSIKPDEYG